MRFQKGNISESKRGFEQISHPPSRQSTPINNAGYADAEQYMYLLAGIGEETGNRTRKHACIHTYIYIYISTYIYKNIHTYRHTLYIRTHTHTHTHVTMIGLCFDNITM